MAPSSDVGVCDAILRPELVLGFCPYSLTSVLLTSRLHGGCAWATHFLATNIRLFNTPLPFINSLSWVII